MTEPVLFAYFGHHKCATQWTKGIVAELCEHIGRTPVVFNNRRQFGGDLAGAVEDPGHTFVCYISAEKRSLVGLTSIRGFHIVRDPRDIAVSAYFSHLHSHPLFGDLEEYRQRLQEVSEREGLMMELERRAAQFRAMLRWNYAHDDILELRMEDVTTDTEVHLREITRFLGLGEADGVTDRVISAIAERHSFDALAGRSPGTEDRTSHLRKGIAGDWVNHFEPEHVAYVKEHYGPLLRKLGYETSDDWG